MTIADPSAIPETPEACVEYLTEADSAWDHGDVDAARVLYHGIVESAAHSRDQRSHANYRLALIALNQGDKSAAWDFASGSADPAAADLMRSIGNTTTEAAADANMIPQTSEEIDAYWTLGITAKNAKDWPTATGWFGAVAQAIGEPDVIARAQVNLAICLHEQGDDVSAREWLGAALPMLDNSMFEDVTAARELFGEIGVHAHHDPDETDAVRQFTAGIEAYQLGELGTTHTALEAAMHVDGTSDELKGKASYYLGAMAQQARDYATARDRLERSAELASDPEQTWARELLKARWDETP